jgi:hypothetical protein
MALDRAGRRCPVRNPAQPLLRSRRLARALKGAGEMIAALGGRKEK